MVSPESHMKNMRPFIFGAIFGIAVFLLAIPGHHSVSMRSFFVMLPVILSQPARLFMSPTGGRLDLILEPFILALIYALTAWIIAAVLRVILRHRQISLFIVTPILAIIIGIYAATFTCACKAIRKDISDRCRMIHDLTKAQFPGKILGSPTLRFSYCIPILPFVVACEYDFTCGSYYGWNKGGLWVWKFPSVKELCHYTSKVYRKAQ